MSSADSAGTRRRVPGRLRSWQWLTRREMESWSFRHGHWGSTSKLAGFIMAEVVVALAVAGILVAAVASVVAWGAGAQVRWGTAAVRQEQAHQALSIIADILREAGAGGGPAILYDDHSSVIVCGLPWRGQLVRGKIQLDGDGRLVMKGVAGKANCVGDDVARPGDDRPIDLVPGASFSEIHFEFFAAGVRCGISSPCEDVTAVKVILTPAPVSGASPSFNLEHVVTLRNAGSP